MSGTGDGLGGSGLFRGAIPAATPGDLVRYHVVATDRRGNTRVGAECSFHVLATAAVGEAPGIPPASLEITPNPIARSANIQVALTRPERGRVALYDLSGRCVRILFDGELASGATELDWDGRNDAGIVLPRGVYFMELRTERTHVVRKLQLVR